MFQTGCAIIINPPNDTETWLISKGTLLEKCGLLTESHPAKQQSVDEVATFGRRTPENLVVRLDERQEHTASAQPGNRCVAGCVAANVVSHQSETRWIWNGHVK